MSIDTILVMYLSQLNEKEVIGQKGSKIGKVKDTVLDEKTWQISSIEVELEGDYAKDLGMKKTIGHSTFPLPLSYVGAVGDKVMVNVPREELKKYALSLK